jgi:hypothetical protein
MAKWGTVPQNGAQLATLLRWLIFGFYWDDRTQMKVEIRREGVFTDEC